MSLAAGLGIVMLFFGIEVVANSASLFVLGVGVGAIPLLVGCGQLIEYWLRVRELGPRH